MKYKKKPVIKLSLMLFLQVANLANKFVKKELEPDKPPGAPKEDVSYLRIVILVLD